jgi:A/G-specific adenine glycosylase
MLQQTQVQRVIPKYAAFIKAFPTVRALAQAPLRDVLTLWQGLGYNRRAKALHDAARCIVQEYGGRVPHTEDELVALPGVGTYTARAILAFAHNVPVALIETNIRTVLFGELLHNRTNVPDSELWVLAEELIDKKRPREWQWALMDYGAHLKVRGVRLNNASKHYTKQSAFKGSDREVRGAVIRHLTAHPRASTKQVVTAVRFPAARVSRQLTVLSREGLVRKRGTSWSL